MAGQVRDCNNVCNGQPLEPQALAAVADHHAEPHVILPQYTTGQHAAPRPLPQYVPPPRLNEISGSTLKKPSYGCHYDPPKVPYSQLLIMVLEGKLQPLQE